mgnify:CR=1 FL=1
MTERETIQIKLSDIVVLIILRGKHPRGVCDSWDGHCLCLSIAIQSRYCDYSKA